MKGKPGESTPPKGKSKEPASDAWGEALEQGLEPLLDVATLALAAAALVLLLALLGLTPGSLTRGLAVEVKRWLGWAAWLTPIVPGLMAAGLVRRRVSGPAPIAWRWIIACEVALAGLLGVLALVSGLDLPGAEGGLWGGVVGWGIARFLVDALGTLGAWIVMLIVTLVPGVPLVRAARAAWRSFRMERMGSTADAATVFPAGESAAARSAKQAEAAPKPARLPREFRKTFSVQETIPEKAARPAERDERLPPLDLLDTGDSARVTSREINQTAGLIEKTLADFGLPAKVVDFRTGPAVTQFAVEPGFIEHPGTEESARKQKVRVSQISALASDLALALSSPTIRIEAPVPGQAYVGIEVPNRRSAMVRLRPILESDAYQSIASPLAIGLGRDVAGAAVAADLAGMPHMLIAGTTGSGKSVCITTITACLVMNNAPEDLRLVMIDPKMVELVRFNGLPHLYGKVETDLERIVGVLRWCTAEMDRRYKLLEEARARDLDSYNKKARRRPGAERLPRIVVLLDELADLMMMAPDQTERTLVRLAQMARATGIHLVVATQRPSTDIVTGLIKANFPARVSFAVASSVDSRVILDTQGAESLLGRGDMLFLSADAAAPQRLQGAFVSDAEIQRVVDYWKAESAPESERPADVRPPWEEILNRPSAASEEADDVLERAIELVKQTGTASASMLQRRLRIGYPRAARLMDELEELGIVGHSQSGGRTREVLRGDEADDDE
ncbi:MAG: DNA translocase FtsK [Chloroflexi bacterium]|nr:DNA translocase FtsK [Chloroflexota bacterium]